MREGEETMGEAAKMMAADGRVATRDGSRLLARIALRDPDALAELYRMWGDRLYSMALHWIKDEGAAKEALQDCFLRVWKKAADFDAEKSSGFAWCAMILRGLCLDSLRKRRRRAPVWQDWETASALEVPSRGGVEDLLFRETVTRVRTALAHLDEGETESVRAAIFDPGTVQDHAQRWGVPLGTAKIRIHRAMLKLREILRKGGADET
ncbi:MAG: sigma-70 family RNA polymerase sigma factor [Luteolibacter sp.]